MSNGIADLSGPHVINYCIPTPMAAAGTDDEFVIFKAGDTNKTPTGIQLVSATWTPLAAVTANGTNYGVLSVRNRGAAGAGTALPFTRSYIATNSVAFTPEAMTVSGTAADLVVANGDVLTVQRLHTASGVVIPAGLLVVTYTLR
jgi:hypothetical protein